MSDIKNPAPFYTIKEAAKELNRLLKVDYYDSQKLLSMGLAYDLKLYIYSKGWEGKYIYDTITNQEYKEYLQKENSATGYSDAQMRKDDTLNAIADNTISSLLNNGCLLELSLNAIHKFRFNKQYEFNSNMEIFNEAIHIKDAFTPQSKNYFFEEIKTALSQSDQEFYELFYQIDLDKQTLEAITDVNIHGVQLNKPNKHIYTTLTMPLSNGTFVVHNENSDFFTGNDSEFGNSDFYAGEDSELIDSKFMTDEKSEYSNYIIHRKDLLITHSQLIRILEGTLNIRHIGYSQQESIEHQKRQLMEYRPQRKPTGRSKEKEYAQLTAKILARFLWQQDKDKVIKIKEMATRVWVELHQTDYFTQLPDQKTSLKKWIEDEAPEYAREAGRPKENI